MTQVRLNNNVLSDDCPSRDILQSFVLGTLSEAAVDSVVQHLNCCKQCEATLPELPHEDMLIAALRRYGRPANWPNPSEKPLEDSATKTVRAFLAETAAPVPSSGSVVGSYRLLEHLGMGGMGDVFKALDVRLHRVVAVKCVRHGALAGPEMLHRFHTEAEAHAQLEHPNIVRLYEPGNTDSGPFFSMEYVEGGSLAKKLAGGPLPQREAAGLVECLARAVHYAHQRQIIHRDIKPANVLLTLDGTPKLSDFGLAKLLDAIDGFTQTHDVIGTAAYMAPEQAQGEARQVTAAADVYGLGAVLYETLAGLPPFQGSRRHVLEALLGEPPTAPRRLRPDLSRELEAICLKCLEKDPRRRYASANDLADDLHNWLNRRPTKARPPRWPQIVGRFVARRKRACAAGALALVALAVALFAIWYLDPERPRNEVKAALAKGRAAGFQGSEPLPGPFRSIIGGKANVESNPDGSFSLNAMANLNLLEFVDDPQSSHYCVSLDLRHDEAAGLAEVGAFVGFRVDLLNGDYCRRFYTLSFASQGRLVVPSDVPAQPGTSLVHLRFRLVGNSDQVIAEPEFGTPHSFHPSWATGGPTPWYHLEVEVSRQRIVTRWREPNTENVEVHNVTMEDIRKDLAESANPKLKTAQIDIDPRGGLGIFARRSKVSIRNVVVQPLH